jgi:L-threonylcarbamoyladenylate synthase
MTDLTERIAAAAAILRRGGIVAYPTETYYGLGALWNQRGALRRLGEAKLRPAGKPLPLLAADRRQVDEVVAALGPDGERLAAHFWPGPLTLVVPAAAAVPEEITAGTGTVGVRIPGSAVARALAAAAGGALVSTSANLAGEPPAADPAGLTAALRERLDGLLDAGPTPGGLPSTVVALEAGGAVPLRAGAVPWEAIREALLSPDRLHRSMR